MQHTISSFGERHAGAQTIRWKRLVLESGSRVRDWLTALMGHGPPGQLSPAHAEGAPANAVRPVERLRRVVLTDEVARTLFDEYAAHRKTDRGHEETGWVLLGLRAGDEAVALVTLPAGAGRDAGEAHVRFDWETQVIASRIVRQEDRRLTMIGVVHTHPGRLRSPSSGDLRGDREWVANLRGREGVFAIGTADDTAAGRVSEQPADHALGYAGLRFDWYALAEGENRYRKLPVTVTLGPDLASSLRSVWDAIEAHAAALESLAERFRQVRFEIGMANDRPTLSMAIGLGPTAGTARVLLHGKSAWFVHETADGPVPFDLPVGTSPDHGVYLLMADLASRG